MYRHNTTKIVIENIDIPFLELVALIIKFTVACVPAIVCLYAMYLLAFVGVGAVVTSLRQSL